MTQQDRLSNYVVAISISKSPDMGVLGLGTEHLNDAMAEVARYLLAMGARLMYGGDLRNENFTEVLFELVARYQRTIDHSNTGTGVTNFFAWPVHIEFPPEEVKQLSEDLTGVAELVYLTVDGQTMPPNQREQLVSRPPTKDEWLNGLTAMRQVMTQTSNARIVLGGQIEDFKGKMPGVAEEVLLSLLEGQPLFLLGGFGGCANDIATDLGLMPPSTGRQTSWPGRSEFQKFTAGNLNNGLDEEENALLATTVHVDEAMTLILRGLLRLHNNDTAIDG
jgi:hypothetical protein